jgi:hypothetical protein
MTTIDSVAAELATTKACLLQMQEAAKRATAESNELRLALQQIVDAITRPEGSWADAAFEAGLLASAALGD